MTEQQIYDTAYRGAFNGTRDALIRFNQPYVSQVEFAMLANRTPRTVQRWIKAGIIEANDKGKIHRSELEKLKQ